MKGAIAAAAMAAMATGANAHINHRRAHDLFKKGTECKPVCTTYISTIYGQATWVPDKPKPKPTPTPEAPPPPPPAPTTTAVPSTTEIPVVPVPEVTVCETPGTYTIPADTITIDKTVTVCAAASTHLPPGTHTIGEITTVVEGPSTVTCPYADATNGAEAPVTTHFCPGAGVCTVVPGTVTVIEEETDVYYPVPTTYAPGTYTAPVTTITVTKDKFVYYCPYTTSEKPAPQPTKEATPPKEEAPKVQVAKVETPKIEKPKVEVPKIEIPKVEVPKVEKPKVEKKPKVGGGLVISGKLGANDGEHYGITYTPYNPTNGDCMSAGAVEKDIIAIKKAGFTTVRIYSTDCNTLDTVGPACKKHGLKMIVGVFVKGSCSYSSPDVKEQVDAISKWAEWDSVDLIVMGNESIMNGLCTPSELKELIQTCKGKFSGYTGPWTIAETLDIYERSEVPETLCDVIDVVGANVHAYFNPNTPAEKAGDFVKGQLDILDKMCPGKDAINLECGWPNGGQCNGLACASFEDQRKALDSILKKVGSRSVFFSYKNDDWKGDDGLGVEPHFGCDKFFSIV
ncbi:putative beta-glucosidase btgE [Sarocladium implicatum]|nr:putative beta-glucosidase btgE [Sarocladium implicatum]